MINLREIREGDPVLIRVSDDSAATLLDDSWVNYHSGLAHWNRDTLSVRTEGGVEVVIDHDVEIIGWTPQLDFGDST